MQLMAWLLFGIGAGLLTGVQVGYWIARESVGKTIKAEKDLELVKIQGKSEMIQAELRREVEQNVELIGWLRYNIRCLHDGQAIRAVTVTPTAVTPQCTVDDGPEKG